MGKKILHILAQERNPKEDKQDKTTSPHTPEATGDKLSVTRHVMEINGVPLRYKATAGYQKMFDQNQKLKSKIFYISYEKEDVKDKAQRPIMFAFNGGPGASSAWVHFGCMGPKKIMTTDNGEILPPPYKFEDNPYTWLEFTDLVFIDPVGTGYSQPDKDEDIKQFLGVEEDIQWVGDFIRLYITKNKRWLSPKYIGGESYGTFRSAGLASYLQNTHAMDLNGIILISTVLNYQTFIVAPCNDLPYILYLPSYTATAFYHKKLHEDLQKDLKTTLKEAEEWAVREYSVALLKGDTLPEEERKDVICKMSRYTGLSPEYIDASNLRVQRHRFMKKLLAEEKAVVGLYDGRLKAVDLDPAGEDIKTDPSMFNVFGPCVATLNAFLRSELKYENDLPYFPLGRHVGKQWNWKSGLNGSMGYVDVTQKLIEAVNYNPYLKVLFVCGYYDLCTPYFIAQYNADHMGLPPQVKKNVMVEYYEGGHMMYVHLPSRKKLFDDVRKLCENNK